MKIKNRILVSIISLIISLCFQIVSIKSAAKTHQANTYYHFIDTTFHVNSDYSYTTEKSMKVTLNSENAIKNWRQFEIQYYPKTESIQIIDAYVTDAKGQKYQLTKNNIVTYSTMKQDTKQKVRTLSIYSPRLDIGSQFYIHYKIDVKEPEIYGFNKILTSDPYYDVNRMSITIDAPRNLKLRWRADPKFQVKETEKNERQIIHAKANNIKQIQAVPYMISRVDVSPMFMVSSLKNNAEIGNIYWHYVKNKVVINDEIKMLAKKIVGNKKGIEAIYALNNWVASAIKFHSMTFDLKSHFVPNSSVDTLYNRFGDCKDKVTLLQALANSVGIKSYPVIVQWGNSYREFKLPEPGQYNHLMIYFPEYDLYSNPTDENSVVGNLDMFLMNKSVILAGEASKVSKTPQSDPKQNRYLVQNKIYYDAKGNLHGSMHAKLNGGAYLDILDIINSYANSSEFVRTYLSYTQEGGNGFADYQPQIKGKEHRMLLKGEWVSSAAITVDNIVVLPIAQGVDIRNPTLFRDYIVNEVISHPILLRAQENNWDYEVALPKGYKIMHLPKNIQYSNREGKYTSHYELKKNKIIVKRQLIINNDIHQPKDYKKLKSLITLVLKDFRNASVLNKA